MIQYFKNQVRTLVFLDITLWRINRWCHRNVYGCRKSKVHLLCFIAPCPPVWSRAESQASGVLAPYFPLLPVPLGEGSAVWVQRAAWCRPRGIGQRPVG